MYGTKRIEYITWQQMNKHLEYCESMRKLISIQEHQGEVGLNAIIDNRQVEFTLTYKVGSKVTTYSCRKDEKDGTQFTNGAEAFKILSQYYKVPDLTKNELLCKQLCYDGHKFLASAKPLLWKNDKYDGKRVKAYSYDLNSSYSFAMLQDMPDTSKVFRTGEIRPGEIGFIEDGDTLKPIFKGFSLWIFPLMPSPFKKFVKNWYEKKSHGNNKAKGVLNYSVGYLQKKNPFLRATILYHANKIILDLIDENTTLYCNTDSIVSLVPINVKIGSEIGEFKLDHEGMFAYKGFNYQWNKETPHYRGVPKSWFKKNWDILKDEIPDGNNIVEYINKRLRITK